MDSNMTLMLGGAGLLVVMLFVFAFASDAATKAKSRRMTALKERHGNAFGNNIEKQLRKIAATRADQAPAGFFGQLVPKPELIRKRLEATGKGWTLNQYAMTSAGIGVGIIVLALLKGVPFLIALLLGIALGMGLPHFVVGSLMKRRINNFTSKFPDAIELMVRGLRSGLPITETLGIVGTEVPDPVGLEFRTIGDRIKIGKTMEDAFVETSERLGTPEFKFFCITLSIQRETGGNLAETLSNLAEVLRKRAQMKLKIKAMSSESKASAYIIGVLPFMVFGLIYTVNSDYMGGFFTEPRLMIAGGGGLIWMSIGAFIMSRMISFEI